MKTTCSSLLAAAIALCAAGLPIVGHGTLQEGEKKNQNFSSVKRPVQQPIPFSHKQHSSLDVKCAECHPNPDPGDRMTIPATEKCMECHRTLARNKFWIQKLAEFAKAKQQVPWVRVYVVSAWVFWNHRSHLEAGMKCESCHGDVAKMDVTTAATSVTTMASCVECHKKNDASTGCQFCHAGR